METVVFKNLKMKQKLHSEYKQLKKNQFLTNLLIFPKN